MIFTIKTNDEISGLDITAALVSAGIFHTILSKQNDNDAHVLQACHRCGVRQPENWVECSACGARR